MHTTATFTSTPLGMIPQYLPVCKATPGCMATYPLHCDGKLHLNQNEIYCSKQ